MISAAVDDPQRYFATANYCTAKDLFEYTHLKNLHLGNRSQWLQVSGGKNAGRFAISNMSRLALFSRS